jgi:hypothetical protein
VGVLRHLSCFTRLQELAVHGCLLPHPADFSDVVTGGPGVAEAAIASVEAAAAAAAGAAVAAFQMLLGGAAAAAPAAIADGGQELGEELWEGVRGGQLNDAKLLQLLIVRDTLTDLELNTCGRVTGPGLASVLQHMTSLTSLTVHDTLAASEPGSYRHLLPLPPCLQLLHVWGDGEQAPGAREALQAAVDAMADCRLLMGKQW